MPQPSISQPEISIITPVLNGEPFIAGCLQNIIAQKIPTLEHLIVDGGSTDRTLEIIKHFSTLYPHIRWQTHKPLNQSQAMNQGVALARGNIIGMLNVDDYYEDGALGYALALFKQLPEPSFLVGNCRVRNDYDNSSYINKPRRLNIEQLLLGPEINPFPFNSSAYFYHRSLHERIGGYDERLSTVMDVDFIFRAVQTAHVVYVNKIFGNQRVHKGCKTYQGLQNGSLRQELDALIEHTLTRMPLSKQKGIRIRIRLLSPIKKWHPEIAVLIFFVKHPAALGRYLGVKFQKLIHHKRP